MKHFTGPRGGDDPLGSAMNSQAHHINIAMTAEPQTLQQVSARSRVTDIRRVTRHMRWLVENGFAERHGGNRWALNRRGLELLDGHLLSQTDATPIVAADLDAPPADRVQTTVSRIIRDTELANWVKSQHGYRCQLCGETIRLADGSGYAEGHHLRPLGKPHDGPDVAENIVCLCPNHHAACDLGAIRLELHGLQLAGDHIVGEQFVTYHNKVIFRG